MPGATKTPIQRKRPATPPPLPEQEKKPPASGRLLVAVGASPLSGQLVHWARRTAAKMGVPWAVVYVERARPIGHEAQAALDKNLALARELGAEVIIALNEDVAEGIRRVALKDGFAQIIVGQSRSGTWLSRWSRRRLADRLIAMEEMVEVHVVPAVMPPAIQARSRFDLPARSSWREYALVFAVIATLTAIGMQLPKTYYVQIGLVYLLAINLLSLRVGRGPILTAGVVIALTWDYIFAPPYFQFGIDNVPDLVLFGTYFVVALIAGEVAARLRAQARSEQLREERATALFHFTKALAEAKTLAEAALAAMRQIDEVLGVQTALAFADGETHALETDFRSSFTLSEREIAAAIWAFRNRRSTGRFTETDGDCAGYYVPLVHGDQAFGVLGVKVPPSKTLTLGERDLLDSFAQQLALVVERTQLRAAGEREKLLAESEKLHRALLESVSHELRTPLAVITATSEELAEANLPGYTEMVGEIHEAGLRLQRLVANLLDQTRLESGALKPRLDWCDPQDLINAALEGTRDALAGRPVEISVPVDMPLVRADFTLTEQVLTNLLLNAARHTPAGTPISIEVGVVFDGKRVFFSVSDRGPGIPVGQRDQLFKKFARGATAAPGGLGLGLSIVRGFIAAQGGEVVLGDNSGGGAKITLYLPHIAPDNPPPE